MTRQTYPGFLTAAQDVPKGNSEFGGEICEIDLAQDW